MESNKHEWVSVSDYAQMIGKSKQTVYNMIRAGKVKSKTFRRGSMCGLLVYA